MINVGEVLKKSPLFREACERIADMLRQDDGEAFFEAEKFLKRHAPDLYNKIGLPKERPEPGQKWQHYNGAVYSVVLIANLPDNPRYPETVVYRGENEKNWSRPLSDWHRSMTKLSAK